MDQLKKTLKEIEQKAMKYYQDRDFKAISNLYTENCVLYMPGCDEPHCGRDGVMKALSSLHNCGVASFKQEEDDLIYGGGDHAICVGRFSALDSDGKPLMSGKFQTLLKKVGDQWFCHRDFSNADELDLAGHLRESFRKWNELFMAGDYNRLVSEMYTDDCRVSIPGKPMVHGKTAVLDLMKAMLAEMPSHTRGRAMQKQGEVVSISDDCAVEIDSKFAIRDQHGVPTQKGRYMCVWKKVGDCWRIHADIMNEIVGCPMPN